MEVIFKLNAFTLIVTFDALVVVFVFFRFFAAYRADLKNPKSTSQDKMIPEKIAVVLFALVNMGAILYDMYID